MNQGGGPVWGEEEEVQDAGKGADARVGRPRRTRRRSAGCQDLQVPQG